MGAQINISIALPAGNPEVTLNGANEFTITGTINPSDPTYVVAGYLIRSADLATRINGVVINQTADSYAMRFTVPAGQQHVSLNLTVVAEDGNDTGGIGMSIRCVPPPPSVNLPTFHKPSRDSFGGLLS